MAYCSSENLLETALSLSCTGCGQLPPFDLPKPPDVPGVDSDSLLWLLSLLLLPLIIIAIVLGILKRAELKKWFETHCCCNKVHPEDTNGKPAANGNVNVAV